MTAFVRASVRFNLFVRSISFVRSFVRSISFVRSTSFVTGGNVLLPHCRVV